MSMIQVTICPPGRRSKNIVDREPVESPIPVTTATALTSPAKAPLVPSAKDDRRPAQERVEAAQRAEAISVALAQPHRAGSADRDLSSPLGQFCRQAWPGAHNGDHRRDMLRAGQQYGEIVHQHRVNLGLGGGPRTQAEGGSAPKSEAQIVADLEKARIKRDDADATLREVGPGAISAMMRLCVDEMALTPYQEGVASHALWKLAVRFGIVKLGRFGGLTKPEKAC